MSDNTISEVITPPTNNRPTLGFLTDSTIHGYEQAIWRGVVERAKARDVNLVTFNVASQYFQGTNRELSQTIDLITENNLQGLILTTATILDIISMETLGSFLARFQPLPMLSIGVEIEGLTSLVVDNYQGMRAVIDHLIEDHGYKRIAYLQMVGDNPEARERFRGYTESLADHNILFDPDLVVPGDFFGLSEETVNLLLDDRKIEFDALVAVNDDMATNVMQILQARGFQIPGDIAIAGFDDHEISRYLSPPLTTARQPLGDLGHLAVDLLLAQINQAEAPQTIHLPTELVVRQSCGCIHPDVAQAFISDDDHEKISGIAGLITIKDEIIAEILRAANASDQFSPMISEVFVAYIETINQQSPDSFIKLLTLKTDPSSEISLNEFNWHPAITVLRQYTLRAIDETKTLLLAENLFQQARTLIAEVTQRVQANLRLQAVQDANFFRTFSQRLTTLSSQKSLFDMLAQDLPGFGIPSGYLVINEKFQPKAEQRRLLMGYTSKNQLPLPPQGLPLQTGEFPQTPYLSPDQHYNLLVEGIGYQNQESGFIIFEAGSDDGSLYRGLANQVSSTLENVILVEQVEQRALQLQTASEVSQAASSILDPQDLIQQIVNLVKERFHLYYAGMFIVDDNHRWAVLQAGTGNSGQKMLAENWRLEIGGDSMIGRCITTGEADIQLDIDKAPVHLRNPHLPDTKSEMALPLFSRGTVMGALTIQSEESHAFSLEDAQLLQTMANQAATAIANARLFEQTQTALLDTETLLNISRLASSSVEIEKSLEQVLDLTLKSTGITAGLFSVVNPVTRQLEISAHQIPQKFLETLQEKGLDGTLCDLVYRQRKSIIVANLAEDSPIDAAGLLNLGLQSYQGVPLETKGEIFGTLCTFSNFVLRPEDSRVILLEAIGQQVGVAIENSILFERTQIALSETAQQSERLAALNELSGKLAEAETLDEIYRASASVISQIIPANRMSITNLLEDGKHAELLAVVGDEGFTPTGTIIELKGTPPGDAIKSQKVISFPDPDENKYAPSSNLASQDLESYLIVPLMISGKAIGSLNFGWTKIDGLTSRDRDLAIQTGSLISNAIANQNLLQQTQETLAELETTQRRYQIQAWSTYNRTRSSSGYQKTPTGLVPLGKQKISEADKAIQEQAPMVSEDGEALKLTIPIMLRDQPIGAIGLQAGENKRQWSAEEINLAKEISEQFALAAESIRLLDETQRRAAREHLVAEITTKIRANNDPQTMIQTTAHELREALQAKRTQVIIQSDSTETDDSERGEK